ncbi:hypothetical protein LguiA_017716 [Lonicera macranthoides]
MVLEVPHNLLSTPTFPQNQSLPLQTILPVHSAVNLQNSAHIQSSKEMDSQGNRQKSHLQHSPNDISRDLMPYTSVLSKSDGKQVVFVDFLQKNAENISTCIPMAEAVVLPFPQVSNSSSRSNNTVPVEENSQSHLGSKNGSLQPIFSQNAQQNTMLSQLQIPVVYVEDGSNLPPKHPPTIPSLNIQQFPPLPSRQKTVAVGLSAQCTDSVTMQTVSAAPVYSNPTAAQGSMPASSCTYTQTSTSHIPPHTLAVTNLDSSTVNHTSSPIPTKANFASLFHHSELTTPIPLAPLPTSYSKGSLPAIKLNEEVLPSSNKNSKAALPANLQQTTKSDSRQKKVAFMPTVSVPSSPPTIPIISTSDPPTNHANTNLDHSPSKFVSVSHNSQSNPVQSSDSAEHTNASETNSHKAVLPSSNSSFTQHSPSPCLNRSLTNQSVTLSNSVDNDWDGKPLPQFRTHSMRSSQSNYGISTSDSHTQQFTRSRHNNKYSPFSEHLLDDDGDGEAWDHSSEENYIENQEHFNDCSGFYSLANSNQFIAVHRPPVLNVQEALNWENMADDEPFQSWEARADAEFEAAVAKNNDEEGIVSPPHGNSHISISSHGSTSKGGLEYVPSPVQTRAQRQKKGTTLSLNKKNKLKKASSREKKEVEAAAPGKPPKEAQSNSLSSSQPLYQWQVHLQDKKKR